MASSQQAVAQPAKAAMSEVITSIRRAGKNAKVAFFAWDPTKLGEVPVRHVAVVHAVERDGIWLRYVEGSWTDPKSSHPWPNPALCYDRFEISPLQPTLSSINASPSPRRQVPGLPLTEGPGASPPPPLFPDSLYRAAPESGSTRGVAELVSEQKELLAQQHLRVVEARSYLRSPPRRHWITNSDMKKHPSSHHASSPKAATSSTPPAVLHAALQRHSLPPLQTVVGPQDTHEDSLSIGAATVMVPAQSTALSADHVAASVDEAWVRRLCAAFYKLHPEKEQQGHSPLQRPPAAASEPQSLPQLVEGGDFVNRSMSSTDVAQSLLSWIPRVVSRCRYPSREASLLNSPTTAGGVTTPRKWFPKSISCAVMRVAVDGVGRVMEACGGGGICRAAAAVAEFVARILQVAVGEFHGDVLDVLLQGGEGGRGGITIAWFASSHEGEEAPTGSELLQTTRVDCCRMAAACAVALQKQIAVWEVPNTDGLALSIRSAISSGVIDCEILSVGNGGADSSSISSSSSASHQLILRGTPLVELTPMLAAAQMRDICVSMLVRESLQGATSGVNIKTTELLIDEYFTFGSKEEFSHADLSKTPSKEGVDGGSHRGGSDGGEMPQLTQRLRQASASTVSSPAEVCFRLDRFVWDATSAIVPLYRLTEKNAMVAEAHRVSVVSQAILRRKLEDVAASVDIRYSGARPPSTITAAEDLVNVVRDFVPPELQQRLFYPFTASTASIPSSSLTLAEMRFAAIMCIRWKPPSVSEGGNQTQAAGVVSGGGALGHWHFELMHVLGAHPSATLLRFVHEFEGFCAIVGCGILVAERDPCLVAVSIAAELQQREADSAISIVAGPVAAMLMGHSNAAQRWGVSGFGSTGDLFKRLFHLLRLVSSSSNRSSSSSVVVDSSVWEAIRNRSLLTPVRHGNHSRTMADVSSDVIYTLAEDPVQEQPCWLLSAVPSTFCDLCHAFRRKDLKEFIEQRLSADATQLVAVISGPSGIGKSVMCTAVSQQLLMTPAVHECQRRDASRPLEIARTMALWFLMYHHLPQVVHIAGELLDAYHQRHFMKMRAILIRLFHAAEKARVRTVVVVKEAQWLDSLSLGFLKQFLRQSGTVSSSASCPPHSPDRLSSSASEAAFPSHAAHAESSSVFAPSSGSVHHQATVTWAAFDEPSRPVRKRRAGSIVGSASLGLGASVFLLCVTPTNLAPSTEEILQDLLYPELHDSEADIQAVAANTLALKLIPVTHDVVKDVISRHMGWELDTESIDAIVASSRGIPGLVAALCAMLKSSQTTIVGSDRVLADGTLTLPTATRCAITAPLMWVSVHPLAHGTSAAVHWESLTPIQKCVLMVCATLTLSHHDTVFVDIVVHMVVSHLSTRSHPISKQMVLDSIRSLETLHMVAQRKATCCAKVDAWRDATSKSRRFHQNKEEDVDGSTAGAGDLTTFEYVVGFTDPMLWDHVRHRTERDSTRSTMRQASRFLMATIVNFQRRSSTTSSKGDAEEKQKQKGTDSRHLMVPPWMCPLHVVLRYVTFRAASGDSTPQMVVLVRRVLSQPQMGIVFSDSPSGDDEGDVRIETATIPFPLCVDSEHPDREALIGCRDKLLEDFTALLPQWRTSTSTTPGTSPPTSVADASSADDGKGDILHDGEQPQPASPSAPTTMNNKPTTVPPMHNVVIALQSLTPPIALGFTPLSIISDLMTWFKNAVTTIARKRSVPEKAMERGRALVLGLVDALRRLAPVLEILPVLTGISAVLRSRVEAYFSLTAIDGIESTLTNLTETVIRLKGFSTSAQAAVLQCVQEFTSFLQDRVLPSAAAFEAIAMPALNHLGETVLGLGKNGGGDNGSGSNERTATPLPLVLPPRMDAARRQSVEALMRALRDICSNLNRRVSKSGPGGCGDEEVLVMIRRSLTILAVSEFNTRSSKFSLPWLRDRLLVQSFPLPQTIEEEAVRADTVGMMPVCRTYVACLVASYLSLTTVSGRASVVLSHDLATPSSGV